MHTKPVFPLWFVLVDEPVEPQRETVTTTANGNTTTQTLDFTYDSSGYPYALTYTNGTAASVTHCCILERGIH